MSAKVNASKVLRFVAVVIGALLIVGVFPIRYLASPRWEVWVVAVDGKPLPGINVRLEYQDYSAEGRGHELTLMTDETGHCLFPPQYGRASFFQRVFFTLSSAMAGVHASFGPHAFVFAFGGGYEGDAVSGDYVTDWTGSPGAMESRIVAKRTGG